MKNIVLYLAFCLLTNLVFAKQKLPDDIVQSIQKRIEFGHMPRIIIAKSQISFYQPNNDSLLKAEIDKTFWAEISRTVKEGDFEGYKATCHENAVLVTTSGKNKQSYPMTAALARWKQGFTDTKDGKQFDNVQFRFSQRIGDETTAHETGIFYFTSRDSLGKLLSEGYTHLEALLVKQNGLWLILMEYQKAKATKDEWDALK